MDISLKSIRLRNFKRHADLDVEFAETLTVIRGANYSGKSSVLQGIFFALFGAKALPGGTDVIQRRVPPSEGAREKLKRSDKAIVTLCALFNGEERFIERTAATAAVVTREGEKLATGHTAVNEWIEQQTGLDMRRTLMLAHSEQDEASALLTLGAPALNRLIETISEADYVDVLVKRAGKRITAAQGVLASIGELPELTPLQQRQDILSAEIAGLETQRRAFREMGEELKTQIDGQTAQLNALEMENTAVRKRQLSAAQLDSTISHLTIQIEELKKELYQLVKGDEIQLKKQLEKKQASLARLEKTEHELKTASAQYAQQETEKSAAIKWQETTGAIWQRAYDETHHKLAAAQTQFEQLDLEYRKTLELSGHANSRLQAIQLAIKNNICHACKRPYNPAELEKAEKELSELQKDFDVQIVVSNTARDARTVAEAAVKKLQAAMPPSGWEGRVQANQERLDRAHERLAHALGKEGKAPTAKTVQDAAERAQAAREEVISTSTALRQAQAAAARLAPLEAELARKTVERAALVVGAEIPTADLREELTQLGSRFAASKEGYIEAKSQEAVKTEQRNSLQAQITEIGRLLTKRQAAEHRAERFKGLQDWLRDNKAAFLGELWDQTLAGTSEFVRAVLGGDIERVQRSDDGEFSYFERGIEQPVTAASGAQKAVMGIGLRMALPALIPQGVNFIVLDEPSASMDEQVATSLAGVLRSTDRQVILVTHRHGEEFSADAVISLD